MITVTKSELEEIYRNNDNWKAAEMLGISVPTMMKLLRENKIKEKGQGGHNHEKKIRVVD